MKKLVVTFLSILMLCVLLASFCTAVEAKAETINNVHLVAPVSIEYGDNLLFVADNITDEKSVVHIFNVQNSNPSYVDTIEYEFSIKKLRFFNQKLYILTDKNYVVYDILTKTTQSFSTKILDVAQTTDGKIYFLKEGGVFLDGNQYASILDESNQILSITIVNGLELFAVRSSSFNRYDTKNATTAPSQPILGDLVFFDSFSSGSECLFLNATEIVKNGTVALTSTDTTFYDATAINNELFVLLSNNKIYKYVDNGSGFEIVLGFEIGSEVVEHTPPQLHQLNKFTLVRSKGYPSNIVYKTTDSQNSIADLIGDTLGQTYIVLGYDGDENDDYFYVFINGKFGWVKKSAKNVENDQKIEIVKTSLNENADFFATLMSANAVNVYYLPYAVGDQMTISHTFNQSPTNLTKVKLLQQFDSVGQTWYFVSYNFGGTNHIGFVRRGDVGSIYSQTGTQKTKLVAQMKINASIKENVNVFLTEKLDLDQATVDGETGQKITLKTGTIVNVIEQTENASYLQIVYQDGTTYFGWVDSSFLIDINSLTTNSIVGIALTGVALAAAAIFVAVFKTKKQRFTNNTILVDDEDIEE